MCHALLTDIKFLRQLVLIDQDLAEQVRRRGCPCGGPLHQAHFPRKPRGCPVALREEFSRRLSFCCGLCRRRVTANSVRFLGRRVHLALAVVLGSACRPSPAFVKRLAHQLTMAPRTLKRWRLWWREHFPVTDLWRTLCARFMPPVDVALLPQALFARFGGSASEAMQRLLMFLAPLSGSACAHVEQGSINSRRGCQ